MEKKGELAFQYVIVMALLLIVFVIIVMIMSGQLTFLSQGFFGIGNSSMHTAKGDSCETFFGDRVCNDHNPDENNPGDKKWIEVSSPSGTWKDCATKCFQKTAST